MTTHNDNDDLHVFYDIVCARWAEFLKLVLNCSSELYVSLRFSYHCEGLLDIPRPSPSSLSANYTWNWKW